MKYSQLLSSLLVASASIGAAAQSNPQPTLGSVHSGSVQVTAGQVAVMPARFVGIKFGKSEFGKHTAAFSASNTRMVNSFRSLSPISGQGCILTLGADFTKWVPGAPAQTAGQVSQADIEALAGFLNAANCKLDYTAEILNNTPANAANEIAYVERTVTPNWLGFGFGNEPDGSDFNGISAVNYAKEWNTFAEAALSTDSKLLFKGPETGIASNLGTWLAAWYQQNAHLPLAYGAQHYYVNGPAGCATCTSANALESRAGEAYWSTMVLEKNRFGAGLAKPLPVALTETNNFYDGGAPGVSNSFASALYSFDFMFQAAQAGFSSVQFMETDNWSQGYSPLNVINGYVYGPKLEYYGMYLAALAGYGPMLTTTVNANGVRAYAISSYNEEMLNTALVNTSNTNYELTVDLPAGKSYSNCSIYVLSDSNGLGDTTGSGVTLQGAQFDSSGLIDIRAPYTTTVRNSATSVSVPAYAGVLVKCPTN